MAQPFHAVQPAGHCQQSVDAVGDDGSDQGFLVLEVVVHLRRQRRPPSGHRQARAGDAVVDISCAAAETIRSRAARPLGVSRCGSVTHWFAAITFGQVARPVAAVPAALIPLPEFV